LLQFTAMRSDANSPATNVANSPADAVTVCTYMALPMLAYRLPTACRPFIRPYNCSTIASQPVAVNHFTPNIFRQLHYNPLLSQKEQRSHCLRQKSGPVFWRDRSPD